jgi:hypothetical protein
MKEEFASRNCGICQTVIGDEHRTMTCGRCGTTFHRECWDSIGGCGTQGCDAAPEFKKEPPAEETHWGAVTKRCPMCGETIKVSETRCPYCNESFGTSAPMTTEEVQSRAAAQHQSTAGTGPAITIFILGLLGCPAPLNLIIGGVWYLRNRARLREVAPTKNLLAIVGLAASAVYTLLMFGALVCRSS